VVEYFAYHKDAFDEVMDGVVYTVVASLGFACMENILYVLPGGPLTALVRAFTAIPLHAFASGLMGYYIGRAKFAATPRQERALIRTGLIVAVVIHGTYDFLLFASGSGLIGRWWSLGIVPLLFATLLALRSRVRRAKADDLHSGRA
jgi:RsiW-degrading membrane proteinase PrsW (M82 family)